MSARTLFLQAKLDNLTVKIVPFPKTSKSSAIMLSALSALVATLCLSPSVLADRPPPYLGYNYMYYYWADLLPKDWEIYSQIWDPDWMDTHLDHVTSTSCLCSSEDGELVSSYMHFEYYNYQMDHTLDFGYEYPVEVYPYDKKGPQSWREALGNTNDENARVYARFDEFGEVLSFSPFRKGRRWVSWKGQARMYDYSEFYGSVHNFPLPQDEVLEICQPICQEKWGWDVDTSANHDPSFVITYYPPRPILWGTGP